MIQIINVTKQFRTKQGVVDVLKGIDLHVEEGEFFVLLGPSGSGKTTLLRCVAGLEKPDTGRIVLAGQTVFSDRERTFVAAADRGLGMVFQSYAIWPHMTVFENVGLPLTQGKRRLQKSLARDRVIEALRLVQMEELAQRSATLLSGGQQQRVALARALAIQPKALLMDEPLGSLDARLRSEVRSEIRGLVKKVGLTVLYVTHDQDEAMALADRIAVLDEGVLLQVGTPQVIYRQPVSATVAKFFGSMNWLKGSITKVGLIDTEIGALHADMASSIGASVVIGVRPEDMIVSSFPSNQANEFEGEICNATFLGDHNLYQFTTQNKTMLVQAAETPVLQGKGYLRVSKDKIVVFPETA